MNFISRLVLKLEHPKDITNYVIYTLCLLFCGIILP